MSWADFAVGNSREFHQMVQKYSTYVQDMDEHGGGGGGDVEFQYDDMIVLFFAALIRENVEMVEVRCG